MKNKINSLTAGLALLVAFTATGDPIDEATEAIKTVVVTGKVAAQEADEIGGKAVAAEATAAVQSVEQ